MFDAPVDDFTVGIFTAMVMTALAERLRGAAGSATGSKIAELPLRMLGVPEATARAVAWRPIGPLAISLQTLARPEPALRD